MVTSAQQDKVVESVAIFLGLAAVKSRSACFLRMNVTDLAGDRAGAFHDGKGKTWKRTKIAR